MMKAAGKAFTLATSILQVSVARRLACLKRTPVITLACCSGSEGILYQRCGSFLDSSTTASGIAIGDK